MGITGEAWNESGYDWAMDDQPRHVATSPDDYSLTIEEAALRYEHAGHPRTTRSIQRYCAQGHLDCLRQETPFGEKYLITPASVARHIAQIEEITRATSRDRSRPFAPDATSFQSHDIVRQEPTTPDEPRQVETHVAQEERAGDAKQPAPTSNDAPRHGATSPDLSERYLARLEGEVSFLREEISTKNAQIKELTERSRETNVLIGGLQRMLAPLLGSPDPHHQTTSSYEDRPTQ
jgi:hypothetical protein